MTKTFSIAGSIAAAVVSMGLLTFSFGHGTAFAADTTAGANDRGDVSLVARDTGA